MSELTIYQNLRTGGLSPAGACAVMGNMFCESALQPDNVENRCPMSDATYTSSVDNGTISREDFSNDQYGYGLCQWTFYTRKRELWNLAKGKGVSIGNEAMQCEMCLLELRRDYPDLYQQLCVCTEEDMKDAVAAFCRKYENPAFCNTEQRYQAAVNLFNVAKTLEAAGVPAGSGPAQEIQAPIQQGEAYVEIGVPVIRKGSKGRHVAMLQAGLKEMGYYTGIFNRIDGIFGDKTEAAVMKMQKECNCHVTGAADQGTWQVLFQ